MCSGGWAGDECEVDLCGGCSAHGTCTERGCACARGWRGAHCEWDTCPGLTWTAEGSKWASCSGHGGCDAGVCRCAAGWGSPACDENARWQVMAGAVELLPP